MSSCELLQVELVLGGAAGRAEQVEAVAGAELVLGVAAGLAEQVEGGGRGGAGVEQFEQGGQVEQGGRESTREVCVPQVQKTD